MTEINKNDVKFNTQVNLPKVQKNDAEPVKNTQNMDIKQQDYKEAAAAPGAEAAGRAQVMISKADNIDADIKKIIANPAILDASDAYFNAAMRAGVDYPTAATFATQEV